MHQKMHRKKYRKNCPHQLRKEVPKELPPPAPDAPKDAPKEVPKELPPPAPSAPKDAPKAAPKSGPPLAPKTSKGVATTAALPAKSSVTGSNMSPLAYPVDPPNIMAASIAGGVISNLILIFIAGSCFFLVKFYKNKKENSRAIATPGVKIMIMIQILE
ncbi:hypothetical protein C1646_745033 [Rhizophagus diaphanus]|nr:hypothetical protein C1646_745033 [Rhizophagus diaphanus] [Rhizophagus sp. MUCL 43196]